ncbi:PREDICTED: ferritin heavy chain-like [Condylura cristata]|uniref:ferritin heavy chain-like n=1 Tax=Condylura cristata TaxID=143302 RepID=UPI0006434EFA|nr:PREDICTED: ferritin heavy chain-like [Condylura cristata]
MSAQSQVLQNYHSDCEATINFQINLELYAAYIYFSMASFFNQDDVGLKHFAEYFQQQFLKEKQHAEKLMEYQNMRGGRIRLQDVQKPERETWNSGLKAMECTLHLKKSVNQNLLNLHQLATEMQDPQLCDFLDRSYLHEQVVAIKEVGDHLTNLRKMGASESCMAEYLFDKFTLGDPKN